MSFLREQFDVLSDVISNITTNTQVNSTFIAFPSISLVREFINDLEQIVINVPVMKMGRRTSLQVKLDEDVEQSGVDEAVKFIDRMYGYHCPLFSQVSASYNDLPYQEELANVLYGISERFIEDEKISVDFYLSGVDQPENADHTLIKLTVVDSWNPLISEIYEEILTIPHDNQEAYFASLGDTLHDTIKDTIYEQMSEGIEFSWVIPSLEQDQVIEGTAE